MVKIVLTFFIGFAIGGIYAIDYYEKHLMDGTMWVEKQEDGTNKILQVRS